MVAVVAILVYEKQHKAALALLVAALALRLTLFR